MPMAKTKKTVSDIASDDNNIVNGADIVRDKSNHLLNELSDVNSKIDKVEEAKRIIAEEEQKQLELIENCKNEIEEITKKYGVDIITIIDKQIIINIVNEFITNKDIKYYILLPEIRNLKQSQEVLNEN